MRKIIEEMAIKNIGSLCLFLNNPKNINYLNYINSQIIPQILNRKLSERVYYFVNKIDKPQLCICGSHKNFKGFKDGYRSSCGNKECSSIIRKNTCIKKYGVDNPKKSKEIIEKEKINILNKWDGQHYMKNIEVREKFKSKMKENWGVEWAQQSKTISEKSKDTFNKNPNRKDIIKKRAETILNLDENIKKEIITKKNNTIRERWGKHYMMNESIRNKIKDTYQKKYGFDSPFMNKEISLKRIESYKKRTINNIKKIIGDDYQFINHKYNDNKTGIVVSLFHKVCGKSFDINNQYLNNRSLLEKEICLNCNPRPIGRSNMEMELYNFIKSNYNGLIIENDRKMIGKEIDIYLPDIKLAFEFNGLYWHSEEYKDEKYHVDKFDKCQKVGIHLIQVWEDDWLFRNEIIKSIILNKIGKSNRIFARKCVIKILDHNQSSKFLEENHIQGNVNSKIRIGLYHNNELVSIMTFGGFRRSLGQISKEGNFELLRFCNKNNYSVIGGASKLFKHFLNNFNPYSIISYSDISRSVGDLYNKLGFRLVNRSRPNYYYIVDGVRKHRYNFRKDILIKKGYDGSKSEKEIMLEIGYKKIYDCGSYKWEYKINK